jgi:hypothetical protein
MYQLLVELSLKKKMSLLPLDLNILNIGHLKTDQLKLKKDNSDKEKKKEEIKLIIN